MSEGTYFLETFGCQMNILDSELVEGQLRARGMAPVSDYRDAELILFNTCSVRQHAEDKVLTRLGQLKRLKQRKPETIVGVIGCMAEREKEGLFIKAPHVDLLCGPGELNLLPGLIDDVRQRHERVAALAGSLSRRSEVLARALEYDSLEALDLSRAPAAGETVLQSYIRVQRGCDKFCTYCVVPFTRGPERSRPPTSLLAEARALVERGCREVTLLGQTVNSYVTQEDGRPVRFAELLERLHGIEGLDRIRFVTSFPADWDEDIFRVMRDCPRVMPYLHIPAQSGSDAVLKRMKRGYTAASYERLMETARRYVPHVALAGDMIVGFCGETEAEFQETMDLARRIEYATLFVFKYSPRPGTKADRNLADDVPLETKARRNQELLALQAEIGQRFRARHVGTTVEVLVEGFSRLTRKASGLAGAELRTRGKTSPTLRNGPARSAPVQESEQDRGAIVDRRPASAADARTNVQLVGRTPQDVIVVFDAPAAMIGALVEVHVESASPNTLTGRVTRVVSPPRRSAPAEPGRVPLPVAHAEERRAS